MGPSLTDNRQICGMVIIENRSVEESARRANQSAEAVTRYEHDCPKECGCMKKRLRVDHGVPGLMEEDDGLQEGLAVDILL